MKLSLAPCSPVRPRVWRSTTLALAAILVGIAPGAFATGNGPPSSSNAHKLDQELTFRADHRPSSEQTDVIVTLNPSSQLPNEFKRFAKDDGALSLINGQ